MRVQELIDRLEVMERDSEIIVDLTETSEDDAYADVTDVFSEGAGQVTLLVE